MISAIGSQYVVQPPSVPYFLYKGYSKPFKDLIEWARKEYASRLTYCAKHGYYKEHRRLTSDYSPKRILAELSGFRRVCALMTERAWNNLSRAERGFISDAFEMRDLLMKETS